MGRTSSKRDEILHFLTKFTAENGYAPSVREICAAVGLQSTATVHYHLNALRQDGLIEMDGMKKRTITLADSHRADRIPVVGVVTAGLPILAVENIEGYLPWDGEALLGDSATVKRFRKDGKQIWLLPENPAYDPIDGNQAQIIGKVKAVIRTY